MTQHVTGDHHGKLEADEFFGWIDQALARHATEANQLIKTEQELAAVLRKAASYAKQRDRNPCSYNSEVVAFPAQPGAQYVELVCGKWQVTRTYCLSSATLHHKPTDVDI